MGEWIRRWKGLSLAEQALTNLMVVWALLFLTGVFIFWLYPAELVTNFRAFAAHFFDLGGMPPLPAPSERFWSVLALSLMATLAFLCAGVAWDIRKRLDWTLPVLVSKAVSTVFYLHFYFADQPAWAYLGGAALSDGPIFVCTFIFYICAHRSQRRALLAASSRRA